MAYRKIIQIEMNELSKDILERFCAAHPSKGFSVMLKDWHHVQTTSEKEYKLFEPWIQWVTAHTGKDFEEHGIFHLGDSQHLQADQIWEVLSDRGIESAIVGCMNAKRGRAQGGIFVPDPWAKKPEVYPEKLESLWKFISGSVQKHATENRNIREVIAGVLSSFGHAIPMGLYFAIARQLVSQKLDHLKKWKLAALFDEFQFALFENILKETNFRFNAVFLNAMAHYQHHYWREYSPDLFAADIQSPDCGKGDNPILFGVRSYDRIIEKALSYAADKDVLVLVMTGLSQVPFVAEERRGGMHYYRLRDHLSFVDALGLRSKGIQVFPLMSRDWQINADNSQILQEVEAILASLKVGDSSLFSIQKNSAQSIFIETAISSPFSLKQPIFYGERNLGLFEDWFASIAIKSGCHVGTGHIWSSQPFSPHASMPLKSVFGEELQLLQA